MKKLALAVALLLTIGSLAYGAYTVAAPGDQVFTVKLDAGEVSLGDVSVLVNGDEVIRFSLSGDRINTVDINGVYVDTGLKLLNDGTKYYAG